MAAPRAKVHMHCSNLIHWFKHYLLPRGQSNYRQSTQYGYILHYMDSPVGWSIPLKSPGSMTPHYGCFRKTLSTHGITCFRILAYSVIWVKYIHVLSIQDNFLGNLFGMILSQMTYNSFSSRLLNLLYMKLFIIEQATAPPVRPSHLSFLSREKPSMLRFVSSK